jgi:copper(I)-binding protein
MSPIKPKIITALLLLVGLFFCGYSSADPLLNIESAYVTALIPGQEVSAGYISISNSGDQDQVLQSFNSSAAHMVQLHEVAISSGIMSMDKVDELVLPAGGSINMQPGGLHLMIMGVDKEAFAGDSVDMQISFANGEVIDINMPVRKSYQ